MTDKTLTADEIFNRFQTRREVLTRAGKLGVAAGLPLALAACLKLPDNAFREGPNGVEIQISHGRNCWGNQCFRYDQRKGEVSVTGREPIAAPAGVDLSKGHVSEAEFAALLSAARKAPRTQSNDGRGSGGGGGAGGPGEE